MINRSKNMNITSLNPEFVFCAHNEVCLSFLTQIKKMVLFLLALEWSPRSETRPYSVQQVLSLILVPNLVTKNAENRRSL